MDGHEIKKIRHDLNLTQKQLSGKMGVSVITIKCWESGRRKASGPAKIILKLLEDGVNIDGYL